MSLKGDLQCTLRLTVCLPSTDPRFESFAGRNEYVRRHSYTRIRSMKLRKELSQGLLMNLSVLGEAI